MSVNQHRKFCLYPLKNWNIFEQILFWLDVIVATSFLIYGFVKPQFVHKDNLTIAYVLNVISYIANLTNVLSILISTQKKISRFWYGIIAAITLGVVAYLNGATGSWILYWIIQLPLQFVGYYFWKKSSSDKLTIKPTSIKWQIWIPGLVIMFLLIGLWSWIDSIDKFQIFWYGKVINKSWIIYICDAGIFMIGLSAAIMMLFRYKEQWILWIVLDVLCIVLWSVILNVQMIIMSSIALLNGCYGLYTWWKK